MAIRESTACTTNPVFKFNREAYSVQVDNIPDHVSRKSIVELFQNLVGDVKNCDERYVGGRSHSMELSFFSRDALMKALCMTGYTVAGAALSVTLSVSNSRLMVSNKHSDDRRNLYVLGLPFDLTKSEFTDIFSRYGKVSHTVILATIDNASRRRGFVVMASHVEARNAMNALSRTEIKGHAIDVSWAVVQRSQGFLDGGDRAIAIAPSLSSSISVPEPTATRPSVNPPPLKLPKETASIVLSSVATSALLVRNLPVLLFSQSSDLQPLLCPFGKIVDMKFLNLPVLETTSSHISVAVQYRTTEGAYEAKVTLDGQMYANCVLKIEFIQSLLPPQEGIIHQPREYSDLCSQSYSLSPGLPSASFFSAQHVFQQTPTHTSNVIDFSIPRRGLASNTGDQIYSLCKSAQ